MKQLEKILKELEEKIPSASFTNPYISSSSVGWHIEHVLLSMDRIVEAMLASNPATFKSTISVRKFAVFTLGKIPRGRAKAPRAVRPGDDITIEGLNAHFKQSLDLVKNINTIRSDQYFEHPYFGHIRLKPAIRFIKIHTRHHLKIIEDILRSAKPQPWQS